MILKVRTTGVSERMPNTIEFNFTLNSNDANYNEVIEKGAREALKFKRIMEQAGADVDKLHTMSYRITEVKKTVEKKDEYGYRKTEYIFDHYNLRQEFKYTMDYDKDKLFDIMENVSLLENPPLYKFNFSLKDGDIAELEDESLAKALKLAQEKAESVRKSLSDQKVYRYVEYQESFIVDHFTTTRYASSMSDYPIMEKALCRSVASVREDMSSTINPEPIYITINVESKFEIR